MKETNRYRFNQMMTLLVSADIGQGLGDSITMHLPFRPPFQLWFHESKFHNILITKTRVSINKEMGCL